MITELNELVDHIIIYIDIKEYKSAMRTIARLTVLFEQFIQQNKDYILNQEMVNLNRCLLQMMQSIEHNDLPGLKKIICSNFKAFLNDWDFNRDSFLN